MKKKKLFFMSFFLFFYHSNLFAPNKNNSSQNSLRHSVQRIAHAGGGINGKSYTNSIDALRHNSSDYNLFEIDFNFTADQELVCIHDWEGSALSNFGKKIDQPPTLKEFEKLVAENKAYKNCTIYSLIDWLNKNPKKMIVTDVKDNNLKALEYIAKKFPKIKDRFIPQIYNPEEFFLIKKLGYKKIIFTLYRYNGTDDQIINFSKDKDFYAVTMPAGRTSSLAPLLKKLGIPTYVHTINDGNELKKFLSLGITEIYTDFLPKKTKIKRYE